MSSGGTSFGTNTNAQRKRVYFTGATAVYEGMPVCYDDSTTNVLGVDRYDSSTSTTTTEGYLNEGRFLRVEIPASDNVDRFAGIVASGPKVGTTGPCWLDIFIPNGAVVPVRTDVACTKDVTVLAIESGEEELGVPVDGTRPVAVARETLSSTSNRLILAELNPDKFICQVSRSTALNLGAGSSDKILNRINVTSAQTAGRLTALEIKAEATSTASSMSGGCGYGLALYTETNVSGVLSTQSAGVGHWTNLNAGADLTSSYDVMELGLYESGATLTGIAANEHISVLTLRMQIDSSSGPGANTQYMMHFRSEAGGSHPDGLFIAYSSESVGMVAKSGTCAISHVIPIRIQEAGGAGVAAGTYYLMVTNEA